MSEFAGLPDCVRYNVENNSTIFSVANDDGDIVAVHEVFLDSEAREIGRRTIGLPDEGFVRFPGLGPPTIMRDEPEEGMRIWVKSGREIWVDVSGIGKSAN